MAIIKKNDKGIMAIDNDLLRSTIIDELRLEDAVVLCNKKGAPVKKTFFGGPDDIRNSVYVRDNRNALSVVIYLLIVLDADIDTIVEKINTVINDILNSLCIQREYTATYIIKGYIDNNGNVTDADLEFIKSYEQD